MTTIRWINHAEFELHIDGVTIVHDPWLEGLAFETAGRSCRKRSI